MHSDMFRIALIYIIVICLTLVTPSRKEVAVIFGGYQGNKVIDNDSKEEDSGDEELISINSPFLEFYSPRKESCIYDDLFSLSSNIFSYTGPPIDNAGTYVDNQAIYVCGGAPASDTSNTTCSVFTGVGSWSNIFYDKNSLVQQSNKDLIKSAMLPWLGDSFIQVGGRNPTPYAGHYNSTYIFTPSQANKDTISEDKSKRLPHSRAGHCFVRTKSEAGHDVYMVIGGSRTDPHHILYVHCIQEDCLDFEWFVADVTDLDDDLNTDDLTCAAFVSHAGEQEVMIVTMKKTYVLSQSCGTGEEECTLRACKMPCKWNVTRSTEGMEGLGRGAYSKVATLDNVPYLFSEIYIYEYNSENNKWYVRQDSMMAYNRLHHTVISVPEDWLCMGHFTTQISVTPPSTTPAPCPPGLHCEATDGRGVHWRAEVNTMASKPCGEGMEGMEATWFCDCSGEFRGKQPNRMECVDKWIRDLEGAIADPEVSSDSIAEDIMENIRASAEAGPGPTGGGLKRLVESSTSLLHKRHDEDTDDEDEDKVEEFTENMLASVSVFIGLEVGWNEIQEEEVRYRSSSLMLAMVDTLGFMFSEEVARKRSCEREENKFSQDNLELTVSTSGREEQCFSFSNDDLSGTICVPEGSLGTNEDDCSTFVSSQLLIDNQISNLFPKTVKESASNITQPVLSSNLLSLTVNNGTGVLNLEDEKIKLTFMRPDPGVCSM